MYMVDYEMEERTVIHTDEYYYQVIRKNIRKIRTNKQLTQQTLADMISVTRQYICDIENEKRGKHVTIAILERIADALHVDIRDFFEEDH